MLPVTSYIFLNAITVLINAALLVFMAQILPNKMNLLKLAVATVLLAIVPSLRLWFDWDSSGFVLVNLLTMIPYVFVFLSIFKGPIWKRFFVFLYFTVIMGLCDVLTVALSSIQYGGMEWLAERGSLRDLVTGTLSLAFFTLFGSISVIVWKVIMTRKFQAFYLIFFVIPTGQLIAVFCYTFYPNTSYAVFGMLLCLVGDLMLFSYTTSQGEKSELAKQLQDVRRQMEVEQAQYREIEARRDELSKIRHDFNNQLATITQLARSGEGDSARELIRSLAEEIDQD